MRPTVLARHLGVAASTLSAAIARLTGHGYISQQRDAADRRAIGLRLSAKGAKAMQASSVLESPRVKRMLGRLTVAERRRALDGLASRPRRAGSAFAAAPSAGREPVMKWILWIVVSMIAMVGVIALVGLLPARQPRSLAQRRIQQAA